MQPPIKPIQQTVTGQVVESCLARRFPIDKPGDSNAKVNGDPQKICWSPTAGQAGSILLPTRLLKL